MAIRDRRFGEVSIDCRRTNPDQHRKIMRIKAFSRTDVDARKATQATADEVSVDGGGGEHHLDRKSAFGHMLIS